MGPTLLFIGKFHIPNITASTKVLQVFIFRTCTRWHLVWCDNLMTVSMDCGPTKWILIKSNVALIINFIFPYASSPQNGVPVHPRYFIIGTFVWKKYWWLFCIPQNLKYGLQELRRIKNLNYIEPDLYSVRVQKSLPNYAQIQRSISIPLNRILIFPFGKNTTTKIIAPKNINGVRKPVKNISAL